MFKELEILNKKTLFAGEFQSANFTNSKINITEGINKATPFQMP